VVINTQAWVVDEAETAKLREGVRKEPKS